MPSVKLPISSPQGLHMAASDVLMPSRMPLYGELKALLLAWLVLPHTKGKY